MAKPSATVTSFVYDPDVGSLVEITFTDHNGDERRSYGTYSRETVDDLMARYGLMPQDVEKAWALAHPVWVRGSL